MAYVRTYSIPHTGYGKEGHGSIFSTHRGVVSALAFLRIGLSNILSTTTFRDTCSFSNSCNELAVKLEEERAELLKRFRLERAELRKRFRLGNFDR